MQKDNIDKLVKIHEKSFNEMYVMNTVINMVKHSCEDREFRAEYYGAKSSDIARKISDERNDYINMLSVVSDRISAIMSLLILMEKEFSLNQNAHNCRR